MKWYLLLKAWTDHSGVTHETDSLLELDEVTAEGLVKSGAAVLHDPEKDARIKAQQTRDEEARKKSISEQVGTEIKKAMDSQKSDPSKYVNIEVHDKSDDDATHGFMPQTHRTKRTDEEVRTWFGIWCRDIYKASDPSGAKVSDLLRKSMERSDKMLRKAAGDGLTVNIDHEGGYLIPPEFSTSLLERSSISAVIRPRATTFNLDSNSINLPMVEDYSHASDVVHGGLTAYWDGENDQLTSSKLKIENLHMELKALTVLGYASHQVMRFSPTAIGSFLLPKFGDAVAFKEDAAFLSGTGAGMPQGILGSAGTIEIAKESGQTADTIVYENIAKMWARLRVESPSSGVWIANRDTFPTLSSQSLTVGTGGMALWVPAGGAAAQPNETLLGKPLLYSEHCQTVGDSGDIILADLSSYIVADDRRGPDIGSSIHLKYDYGQEVFRLIKYSDGRPMYRKAQTPKNGSTFASFLKVAARA